MLHVVRDRAVSDRAVYLGSEEAIHTAKDAILQTSAQRPRGNRRGGER